LTGFGGSFSGFAGLSDPNHYIGRMPDFPDDMPFFDEEPMPRAGSARSGSGSAPAPLAGPSGIAARALAARQGHIDAVTTLLDWMILRAAGKKALRTSAQ